MTARSLGEPVCVVGSRRGTSALRLRFEVDREAVPSVVLRYRPGFGKGGGEGPPTRVWRDNHVVAGLEVPSSLLREKQHLVLELWTNDAEPNRLWQRQVLIERLDRENGLHHLSLVL